MSERIVVTGAAGFIGSHLVDTLTSLGQRVTMIDNLNDFYSPAAKAANISRSLKSSLAEYYPTDVGDGNAIDEIFTKVQPTAVIHLAASPGVRRSLLVPQEYIRNNVASLVTLLQAVSAHHVRKLVFASSSSVYGGVTAIPYREDGPVDPLSPYAVTKLSGEQLCGIYAAQCGFDCVRLRFFSVYGPRQRPDMVIMKFASLIEEGAPLPINGGLELARDYTYVDDVVRAIIAAIETDVHDATLNIGRCAAVTLRDVIQSLTDGLGREATLEMRPYVDGEPKVTCADVSAACRVLGYEPAVSFHEGMSRFLQWYHAERRSRHTVA